MSRLLTAAVAAVVLAAAADVWAGHDGDTKPAGRHVTDHVIQTRLIIGSDSRHSSGVGALRRHDTFRLVRVHPSG